MGSLIRGVPVGGWVAVLSESCPTALAGPSSSRRKSSRRAAASLYALVQLDAAAVLVTADDVSQREDAAGGVIKGRFFGMRITGGLEGELGSNAVIEGDTMFRGTPYHMTAAIASADPIKLARAKAAPACWHRADNALMAGISLKKTANHFTMPEDLHDAILDLLEQRDMEEIGEQAADPEAEEGGEGDGGD